MARRHYRRIKALRAPAFSTAIAGTQRAGISTASAEALLGRMQTKVDGLCAERDRLIGEARNQYVEKEITLGLQIRVGRKRG